MGGYLLQPIIIKKIKFCKKSIEVIYNDTPKENVNFNKIEKILENFINNHKHNDIKKM